MNGSSALVKEAPETSLRRLYEDTVKRWLPWQDAGPRQTQNGLVPWCWTPQSAELRDINVRYYSATQSMAFCTAPTLGSTAVLDHPAPDKPPAVISHTSKPARTHLLSSQPQIMRKKPVLNS